MEVQKFINFIIFELKMKISQNVFQIEVNLFEKKKK